MYTIHVIISAGDNTSFGLSQVRGFHPLVTSLDTFARISAPKAPLYPQRSLRRVSGRRPENFTSFHIQTTEMLLCQWNAPEDQWRDVHFFETNKKNTYSLKDFNWIFGFVCRVLLPYLANVLDSLTASIISVECIDCDQLCAYICI